MADSAVSRRRRRRASERVAVIFALTIAVGVIGLVAIVIYHTDMPQ